MLEEIEGSGCYRWIEVVTTIIGLLAGIIALLQGDNAMSLGSIFFAGMVIIVAVGLAAVFSMRSVSRIAKQEIDHLRQETTKYHEAKPEVLKTGLSAARIGFISGSIYGAILGAALLLLIAGQGEIAVGVFLGVVIACFAGILGIMPAHIGWNWPNSDQAKWAGAIVAAILGMVAMAFLSGDSEASFWVGLLMSPSGWWAAMSANSYRFPREKARENNGGD